MSKNEKDYKNKCTWKQEDDWAEDDCWNTDCGQTFCISEGRPKENGMRYCCFCGKKIRQRSIRK